MHFSAASPLAQAADDSDELLYKDVKSTGERGMKGFYRRPSKAIEQGGGFFVPGLEGERVRLLTAFALLVALLVNRVGLTEVSFRVQTSETVGALVVFLLFAQGISKLLQPEAVIEVSGTSFLALLQASSPSSVSVARAIVQTNEDVGYVLAVRDSTSLSSSASAVLSEFGPVGSSSISLELESRITSLLRPFVGQVLSPVQMQAKLPTALPLPSALTWLAVIDSPCEADTIWLVGSTAAGEIGEKDLKSNLQWISSLIAFPGSRISN